MAIVTVHVEAGTDEEHIDKLVAALARTIDLVAPGSQPFITRGHAWVALGGIEQGMTGVAFLADAGDVVSGAYQRPDGSMPYVIIKAENSETGEVFNLALLQPGNRHRTFRTALSQAIDKAINRSRKGRGPAL